MQIVFRSGEMYLVYSVHQQLLLDSPIPFEINSSTTSTSPDMAAS